jgi:hypothetical protein
MDVKPQCMVVVYVCREFLYKLTMISFAVSVMILSTVRACWTDCDTRLTYEVQYEGSGRLILCTIP